jgi:hypothetical protein
MKAQTAMPTLYDLQARLAADPAALGTAGGLRTVISNALQTFGPQYPNQFATWLTDHKIDPNDAANRQIMIKEFANMATSAEASISTSVRVGAMLTTFMTRVMPNIEMQPGAVGQMLNNILVGNQMIRDYGQDMATHFDVARAGLPAANPALQENRYRPITEFDQQWTAPQSTTGPFVYEAAARLLNAESPAKALEAVRGLTVNQRNNAAAIAHRADPSAGLYPLPVASLAPSAQSAAR